MAKYEDGSYGSAAGIALIAKVLAGRCAMKYTRVAVGKGNIPDDKTPKTMTEPADYVMDAVIAGITNPVDGECQVTVQINSANVDKGFYCTAVVLYAEDPDEGEVPYTYLVLENEPEWIRPASSIVGKLATIDLIAAVGDVDTVTAAIDPEAIATVAAVNDLLQRHNISIHALREEGDPFRHRSERVKEDFYPRPPRGGRPSPLAPRSTLTRFLSTPSARRATPCRRQRPRV